MKMIHAIYEHGVFRPLDTVELPEGTEVVFEPKVVGVKPPDGAELDAIYETMSLRFNTGERDIAANVEFPRRFELMEQQQLQDVNWIVRDKPAGK